MVAHKNTHESVPDGDGSTEASASFQSATTNRLLFHVREQLVRVGRHEEAAKYPQEVIPALSMGDKERELEYQRELKRKHGIVAEIQQTGPATIAEEPEEDGEYREIKGAMNIEWKDDAIVITAAKAGKAYLTAGASGSSEATNEYVMSAGEARSVSLSEFTAARPLNCAVSFVVDRKRQYQLEQFSYGESQA
jgi:hypothetical protein